MTLERLLYLLVLIGVGIASWFYVVTVVFKLT